MKIKLVSRPAFRPAFTLVELMVVIAIVGLLIGVLVTHIGNGSDNAKSVKCATNLKALAAAVAACASSGEYPYAQSAQFMGNGSTDEGGTDLGIVYNVHRGWIHYLDGGGRECKPTVKYPLKSPGSFPQCSLAGQWDDVRYALSQGAIWKAVGGSADTYVCPVFRECCGKVGWSYHMNAFFGYEEESGKALATKDDVVKISSLPRADRTLLFAEIQAMSVSRKLGKGIKLPKELPEVQLDSANGSPQMDGCLWYKSKGGNESIGFNHRRGDYLVGHVAFADGHVETIQAPMDGNFVDLTDWLCNGMDVVQRDGSYEKINDSEIEE